MPDVTDRTLKRAPGARSGSLLLRALVAITATLALGAALPALASATGGHWKESSGLPITGSTSVEWTGKLKATDTENLLGSQAVECSDNIQASVDTSGSGEITKVTVSGCTGVELCEKRANVKTTIRALNLPWATTLEKQGTFIEKIVSGGSGNPGFFVECKVAGVPVEDTCTASTLALEIKSLEPAEAAFDKHDKLTCTLSSGKESGYVEGSQSASGVSGVEEETPVWLKSSQPVTKSEAASWSKGSLTVEDRNIGPYGGTWGVTCESSGEGTVGTEGTDSLTKMTLSKCAQAAESECTGTDSLEAIHLPWKGQLYMRDTETIGNLLAEDGSGVPGFKIKCETGGIKAEETCEASTGTGHRLATYATDEKVQAEVRLSFNPYVRMVCSRDSGAESGELTETSNYLLGFGVQL